MNVKVLGGGCCKCETLLENTKEAITNLGIDAEVEYITDFAVIGSYGIMSTPAIIVDEKLFLWVRCSKPRKLRNYYSKEFM